MSTVEERLADRNVTPSRQDTNTLYREILRDMGYKRRRRAPDWAKDKAWHQAIVLHTKAPNYSEAEWKDIRNGGPTLKKLAEEVKSDPAFVNIDDIESLFDKLKKVFQAIVENFCSEEE